MGDEREPAPPAGYVVNFLAFHVRRFAMPTHQFLQEVLHHFGVELHAFVPNCLLQLAIFTALCEGYLRIDLDFDVFLYFFEAAVVNPAAGVAPWGYCSL